MKNPPKKDVALALLEQGTIYVHLDPRKDGVVVPKEFRLQKELVLSFGYQTRVPIPDLELDDDTLSGTLSFNRRPFWCRIPWVSVYAIVLSDKRGVSWPEDAPNTATPSTPPPKRSHLRAVGPEPEPSEEKPDAIATGPGICKECNTPWIDESLACPVCGSTREEAFKSTAATSEPAEKRSGDSKPPALTSVPSPAVAARPRPEPALALAPDESDRPKPSPLRVAEPEPALAKDDDNSDRESDEPPPPPPKGRPHLRLVKK